MQENEDIHWMEYALSLAQQAAAEDGCRGAFPFGHTVGPQGETAHPKYVALGKVVDERLDEIAAWLDVGVQENHYLGLSRPNAACACFGKAKIL